MKFLRDPLVHFTLAAALLFAVYAALSRDERQDAMAQQVLISEGKIRWLQQTFSNQWQRTPTSEETENLVAGLVEEELLSREAKSLGLDQDDTIIRRRLAQKLGFLIDDTTRIAEPSDAQLRRFYSDNIDHFTSMPAISFRQVYFSPQQRPNVEQDAKAALVLISAGGETGAALGDRLMLDAEFHDADQRTVSSLFGADFANAIFAMTPHAWHGPVASGFGFHLVEVTDQRPAESLPFDSVRDKVIVEWRRQEEAKIKAAYLDRLKSKYGVDIEPGAKALLEGTGQ